MNCKQCGAPIPSTQPGGKCFYCGADPTVEAPAGPAPAGPTKPAWRPAPGQPSSGVGLKLLPLLVVAMVGGVLAYWMARDADKAAEESAAAAASAVADGEPGSNEPKPVAAAPAPTWRGEKPLTCSGNERHALKGATLTGKGGAIRATGSCQVILEGCTIRERTINLEEGAKLSINGGRLEDTLVSARGQSHVVLKNVELVRNTYALRVMDGAQATLEGGSITVKHSPALRLDDQARLSLARVTVTGGLQARDESTASVTGGALTLPESSEAGDMMEQMRSRSAAAITLYGTAVVALRGVTVTGPVKELGGAVIELKPGENAEAVIQAARQRAALIERYERRACSGFIACYTDNGSNGKVDVHVVMPIDEEGKAVGARVMKATGANPKTRACLQQAASERVIDNFEGPPGKLECKFGGTIQGGTQMLSFSVAYVPKDEPKP